MEIALHPDVPTYSAGLSVLDGWWVEGYLEQRTGWAIGEGVASQDDARTLYDRLAHAVLPLYYQDRAGWIG